MTRPINIKRRKLLRYASLGAAAYSLPWGLGGRAEQSSAKAKFAPDVELLLRAGVTDVPILRGKPTRVWKFSAKLLKGPSGTVEKIPGSYLGPVLRLRKGQRVRIRFHNKIPEGCIVHQHGLHVPERADGHPRYEIDSGQTYTYEFVVRDRAGTYWYHTHTHHRTAQQVYNGLAGLILVSDREDDGLDLPDGKHDVPLVIQDRRFDRQNQLLYVNSLQEQMAGFLGDRILVNGKPDFLLQVATRAYRLRLLNGSNSRIYKLAWSDGSPLTVIGTDGGLLERPVQRQYVTLAPAERIEIWADFSRYKIGTELTLTSLAFSGVMPEEGVTTSSALPQGGAFPVLKVRVVRLEWRFQALPARLTTITRYRLKDAANARKPRTITLAMRPMLPQINNRSFQMTEFAKHEIIPLNTLQVLTCDNRDPNPMRMVHPLHVHGQSFQVLKREIAPAYAKAYATLSAGFVDSGWKDTVLVMPGERVTLLKRFDRYKGLYLYHCHNLEHENLGMMRNFLVQG